MSVERFSPCARGYYELAHSFAYATKEDAGTTSCGRMSYRYNQVYSYSTMIARKIMGSETKSGTNILLMCNDRHSNTTAKQKNRLLNALSHYYVIYVDYVDPNGLQDSIDNYNRDLNRLLTSDYLKRKPNREEFIFKYEQLELINEHLQTTTQHKIYADIVENIQNNEIKIAQEKAEKAQKERQEKLKKEIQEIISGQSFNELCNRAYRHIRYALSQEEKELGEKLRNYLQPDKKFSVVWFDFENDLMRTSQNVTISAKEGRVLLKLWSKGRLKLHSLVNNRYEVLAVEKNYVRIGCHLISTENLNALLPEIQQKQELREVA